ncbi:hypothetical protein GT352_28070 [Streptomyces sp. SID1046]|uniref:hypothetical protein n=1 Tax=Streptomyces sp. SID1046 TaxID=2690249 RepID=UPI0013718699|nr:hypothetical protein [Streptomyces sp. SID1046]MYV77758.1 hypothetical protein [Streptomyces sp. SID1046]
MNDAPACIVCHSVLFADEAGRYACHACERRIGDNLAALRGPGGLYARLCLRIHPGSRGAGPAVSGSRGSSMPPNEQVLNLTANGGLVSILETWVEDWASYGLAAVGTGGRLQYRVDRAVATLRLNLAQAVTRHPALDEFADEIGRARRQCEALIDGGKGPTLFRVQCGCGSIIKATLETEGETCRGCRTEYGRREILDLPHAERSAA